MSSNVTQFPRPVIPVPDPLGLYLRVGHSDHRQLSNLLHSGPPRFFGAIIDATRTESQKELREQLLAQRLDVILDPKTQAAATPGGFKSAFGALPWGEARPHVHDDFRSFLGRQRIAKIAEFAVTHGYTQVMAPTHLILSPNDPWLSIDLEAARWLRAELDHRGGQKSPIIYSLALSYSVFRDREQRLAVIAAMRDIAFDSLWLNIDGFGSDANPTAMSNYLAAAVDFHALGVPVVAEAVGGIPGLSLLAFGAVGGIAHGITIGESFSSYPLRKPQESDGGSVGWRVYVSALDLMLTHAEASKLLNSSPRAKALFGCRDTQACPRGVDDMLGNPFRAFVVQRIGEVARLSTVPETIRPQQFLDEHVRPATDRALAATKISWDNDEAGQELGRKFVKQRKRLDDLRISLGARANGNPPQSFALHPPMRIARESRG